MYYKKNGKAIEVPEMKMGQQRKTVEKYTDEDPKDNSQFPIWLIILLVVVSIIALMLCLKMMNKDGTGSKRKSGYPRQQKYGFRFY